MARKKKHPQNPGRLKQIALTYKMTKRVDPKVTLVVAGVGIVTFGVLLAIGFLIGHPIFAGILGFVLAFLAMAIIFGRRAKQAAFGQMEGQPGAAAAVLENVGRGWWCVPAVAMNQNQDIIHRAVGKAGVVLVAEGNRPSCRSRSSVTTARACTSTSRCGRAAPRSSTTSRATRACRTPPATTSAASSGTPRRCWPSPTRR
ncbi:hypothetical protein SANTM175S_00406 [Streptomyces antimycoticus]